MERNELIALAKATAMASLNPATKFSVGEKSVSFNSLNDTFREELNNLAATPADYRENKNLIFSLIETSINEVVPKKALEAYGQFADVKTFPQGDKPIFSIRITEASKARAKKFVTRVGLAGRYEVFKLDGASFEVSTGAYGGAASIGLEEFLDKRITMADVYDIVLEGLNEAVYKEIAKGLAAMVKNLPAVNQSSQTSFDEAEMDRLVQTADVYGRSTLYCTYEFAATVLPQATWASNEMKNVIWSNGCFTSYKGHNMIILPQSFEDATNATKVIDPSLCYIIPTGAEKPVKIAFEGTAQVREVEREDWSREIQTYEKFGVAVYNTNPGICVYKNTNLKLANTNH